ncbi:MAG: hypothetical protein WCT26_04460 [Candidatus Buchananbacteria bacterium]
MNEQQERRLPHVGEYWLITERFNGCFGKILSLPTEKDGYYLVNCISTYSFSEFGFKVKAIMLPFSALAYPTKLIDEGNLETLAMIRSRIQNIFREIAESQFRKKLERALDDI